MKKAGIVLLVLQVLVVFGGLASGNSVFAGVNGGADIFKLLGYFTPGIIGIILLAKAGKKSQDTEKNTANVGADTGKTAYFCPKCGAKAEAGDEFCIRCGSAIKK